MSSNQDTSIPDLEKWITDNPGIVALALFGSLIILIFSDQPYYLIEQTMRLLLFAVIVQIVNSEAPLDEVIKGNVNFGHLLFLWISFSTLLYGRFIEQLLIGYTQTLVAIQYLSLSVLTARIFVASKHYGSSFFRDEDRVIKHFLYAPSIAGFGLPILYYRLQFGLSFIPSIDIPYQTPRWFFYTITLSMFLGFVSWWFFEEDELVP